MGRTYLVNAAKRYAIVARTLGLALLLASAAGTARAQEEGEGGKWSLKAGGFFPTQGTLRTQSGSPYYVAGVEYDPNFRFKLKEGNITFGAELMYRESNGKNFLTVPLTAQVTWNITAPESRFRVYAGLGGGIYIIETAFESSILQPGVKFIVGADITDRFFLETNYHYVGGFTDSGGNGIHPNGLSLLIGYRY
jgi:hypothetical protein